MVFLVMFALWQSNLLRSTFCRGAFVSVCIWLSNVTINFILVQYYFDGFFFVLNDALRGVFLLPFLFLHHVIAFIAAACCFKLDRYSCLICYTSGCIILYARTRPWWCCCSVAVYFIYVGRSCVLFVLHKFPSDALTDKRKIILLKLLCASVATPLMQSHVTAF